MSLLMAMAVAVIPASAANEQPEYLFLKTNSYWEQSSPRFAAYFFGNGETWVDMVKTTNGYYAVKVPTDKVYPKVIFCRMNPSTTANNWTNRWNQTGDLVIPTNGTNLYTVKDNTWDKGGGSWSEGTCDKVGHIFKDGKCTTCEFAGVVFLKPNSNWLEANARFAINLCNGASNAWVSMTDNGDDLYTATIPDGNYTNIIFVRMNPSTTDNNWDNKWNQTADLLLSENNNLFTVPSESWNGATTTWSHYCYGGAATCTEQAKCTVCGDEYGESLGGHNYIDGECNRDNCDAVVQGLVINAENKTATFDQAVTIDGNIVFSGATKITINADVTVVNGGVVTFDSDAEFYGTGKLYVAKDKFVYVGEGEAEGGTLPVWNSTSAEDATVGYYSFYTINTQTLDKVIENEDGSVTVVFRPTLNKDAEVNASVFGGGAIDNAISFRLEIYAEGKDAPVLSTSITEATIKAAYGGETPKAITVTIRGAEEGVKYTVKLVVVSETGRVNTTVVGTF